MMKFKFLFALIVAGVMGFSSTAALSHNTPPSHYHVGEIQPFRGLMCKSQEAAMHIFNTWIEVSVEEAKEVFLIYQGVKECTYLVGTVAYFNEKITSSKARYYDGKMRDVTVFSVSPVGDRKIVDFLLTWEDFGDSV